MTASHANDFDSLRTEHIAYALNCTEEVDLGWTHDPIRSREIIYHRIPLRDTDDEQLLPRLSEVSALRARLLFLFEAITSSRLTLYVDSRAAALPTII